MLRIKTVNDHHNYVLEVKKLDSFLCCENRRWTPLIQKISCDYNTSQGLQQAFGDHPCISTWSWLVYLLTQAQKTYWIQVNFEKISNTLKSHPCVDSIQFDYHPVWLKGAPKSMDVLSRCFWHKCKKNHQHLPQVLCTGSAEAVTDWQ